MTKTQRIDSDFVISTELECLTVIDGERNTASSQEVLHAFLERMAELAPSLRGNGGYFNSYGRVYIDCGHVELAVTECDSPYQLVLMAETLQSLAAQAVADLAERGLFLRLANNNHSGLLRPDTATWGAHENYLSRRHPRTFGKEILPFLVSRVYGGAGGVLFPSGRFLAVVRSEFMQKTTGGSTTSERAIHSTCREEHHMGPDPERYRYHLLAGDGHGCQFNSALHFGATALVLKAIEDDRKLLARLGPLAEPAVDDSWPATLREFNVLARPGSGPAVDPRALETQRVYLDAARRCAEAMDTPPVWVPRLLGDWDDTLSAMEEGDFAWLSARLDAFAKYAFYSATLLAEKRTWTDLVGDKELFSALALLDHSYHDFCDPDSEFARIERAGRLAHRVGEPVAPGSEAEPWVPETSTRARARARFVVENAGDDRYRIDWAWVRDAKQRRFKPLYDPFSTEYGAWENCAQPAEDLEDLVHEQLRAREAMLHTRPASVRAREALRRRAASVRSCEGDASEGGGT